MATITNIPYASKSMNGIITISDGEATMENGDIDANNITTNNISSNTHTIDGDLTVNGNTYLGNASIDIHTVKGKMTFSDTLPECGLAPTTANQLTNKNYTDSNFVYKTGSISETITGIKTFSLPPEHSSTITTNNQMTNKLYVDTKFNSIDLSNYVTLNTAQNIIGSKQFANISIGKATTTNVFDVSGSANFDTPTTDITVVNNGYTAFTGFTAPTGNTPVQLFSNINLSYTLSNWNWTANGNNQALWLPPAGDGNAWYSGKPPGFTYYVGNYSYKGSLYYMQQSFTNLQAGIYIVTFYSMWGGNPTGSLTASLTVSMGNSTDTYTYQDPYTRQSNTWKLRTAKFLITSSGASYIRWTPSDTATAGTLFMWAFNIVSLKYYSTFTLTDATNSIKSYIGASASQLNNAYINNLTASNSLNLTGTPSFLLASPNNNCLVINSAFGTNLSASNQNSLIIGQSVSDFATNFTNCTHIGFNILSFSADTISTQTTVIGQNLYSAFYRDIQIGYMQHKIKDSIGENVSIGYNIGGTQGAGCMRRAVAIGSNIFCAYNGFGRAVGGFESVAIGYNTQNGCADYYNTSVGAYSLQNLLGNNNTQLYGGGPLYSTKYNCSFGHSAGLTQSLLNNCCFFGAFSDANVNNISNATAIGYGATVGNNYSTSIGSGVTNSTANSVRIGRNSDTCYIDGNFTLGGSLSLPSASIADSALSSNIPLKNGANTFSALNTFAGGLTVSGGTLTLSNNSISDSSLSANVPLKNATNTFSQINTFTSPLSSYKFDNSITAIGHNVVSNGTTASAIGLYSVILGTNAGQNLNWTAGNVNFDNTIIGYGAGQALQRGADLTLIGYSAGGGLVGSTSSVNSIAIGSQSLGLIQRIKYSLNIGTLCFTGINTNLNDWDYNVVMGSDAFGGNDCGVNDNSILIGYRVGFGNNNTNTISYNTVIGNYGYINGNYSNSVAISGRTPIINASNTFYVGDDTYTTKTVLNGIKYPNQSQNSILSSTTTLTFPVYSAYSIRTPGTTPGFTITLPTIQEKHLGTEILFRKVGSNSSTVISFIGNGTQNVYNTGLTGGTTAQSLMTSTTITVRLIALVDGSVGTFAWFQV